MKSNKINITFTLLDPLSSGAERVISYTAQNINSKKFSSTLLIGLSIDASYDVKGINVALLEKPKVSKGLSELSNYLKENKTDILVTADSHLKVILGYMSICFTITKFIAREMTFLSADASFFTCERNLKSQKYGFQKK